MDRENQSFTFLGSTEKNSMCLNIQKPAAYQALVFISMLYMAIMLCNAILTNRYIGKDTLFVLGGSFTSPFIFILNDIIAELYGYRIAQSVILAGFACQTLFSLICGLVMLSPYPSFFDHHEAYSYILGPSLMRINISGFAAYMIATLANSYLISRWKILLKGRYFWLRSLGSSILSEGLYSVIAIVMMEIQAIPLEKILKVVLLSYSLKIIYTILVAGPANCVVNYLKRVTGMDIYDLPLKFTPLIYFNSNRR